MTDTSTAPEAVDTIDSITATAAALGLYAVAWFVPFSKSRNKDEKHPSLNWRIAIRFTPEAMTKEAARVYTIAEGEALKVPGTMSPLPSREIIAFDYSAGSGHCPASKSTGKVDKHDRAQMVCFECENGLRASRPMMGGHILPLSIGGKRQHILPSFADILSGLVLDSNVLDAGGFEAWASEYGYDADSRKAESIYRQCLEQALTLRGVLGEKGMERLRLACQDH